MTQCFRLWKIYLLCAVYVAGATGWAYKGGWSWLVAWLVLVPLMQWLYVRFFPRISAALGQGPVNDERPPAVARTEARVTLYRAVGCPFSPIVERRLLALQKRMGFSLRKVDVTLHPGALTRFGTYSVPVVEVDDWNLLGNATTARLSGFIAEAFRVQTRRLALAEIEPSAPARRLGTARPAAARRSVGA